MTQPNTIFIVYKITGALAGTYIVFDGIAGSDRNSFNSISNNFGIYVNTGITSTADADDNIHVGLFNGASSEYWVNGGLVVSGDAGSGSLGGITLGSRMDLAGNFAGGEIMEVIGYNSDISATDRDIITAYLADKWNITATTTHKGYILRY